MWFLYWGDYGWSYDWIEDCDFTPDPYADDRLC